jgi:myo-inositol-1(or 4)-monophosphatase
MLNRPETLAEGAVVRSNEADLELLKGAAMEAGEIAMRFFRQNPGMWEKVGGSPVTEADIAVDEFLRAKLLAARPDYGWLSEETADDPSRVSLSTLFIVDPIDGTRGFIEGGDVWCISVAVIVNGRPAAAALNAAARGELYVALEGGGAWMGGERLHASERSDFAGALLSGPRGWLRTEAVRQSGADLQGHISSLAYRFAQVAAGRLDAAFASPRAHDWDLAASDLLVHEAGGRLTGLGGNPPRYNKAEPRHGVLAAANSRLHSRLLATVETASREVARGRRA